MLLPIESRPQARKPSSGEGCLQRKNPAPRWSRGLTHVSAINELLADADLRRRLGQAGREWILAHFDQDRMVRDTLNAYERFAG